MLLDVRDLKTYYKSPRGDVRAVDGVSFTVQTGESLGLVGESGCGKTTVVKSLIRVLGQNAETVGGQILYKGRDLVTMSPSELNKVRWREISYVAQSAMNALNPVYRVGDQIVETLRTHTNMSKAEAREKAAELFALVGLEKKRLADYPHQLSGGMRQRVVIAMALALDPALVIADEPTTALDVVVQDGILKQLRHIREQMGNSMILVTHDISVVAELCQRMAVMYAGQLAEIGTTSALFHRPYHPYTMGLLNAFPTLESAAGELIAIPGAPPDLRTPPAGCRFAPRCPFATERCLEEVPAPTEVEPGHVAACHYIERVEEFRRLAADNDTWREVAVRLGEIEQTSVQPQANAVDAKEDVVAPGTTYKSDGTDVADESALVVRGLRRWFPLRRGALSSLLKEADRRVHAVDGVDLEVGRGEIVGLAGESGSGKSTLGEVIVGLQPPTKGEIDHRGLTLSAGGRRGREHARAVRELRRHVQMVFQDPYETLNPRFTIFQTVVEPLRNFRIGTPAEREQRVKEALRQAELSPPEYYMDRYPHELSGGQRQRVAIARAIVLAPELLVADEPVSMLDVSVRAGILNLFKRFRDEMGMSIVYVSHDLATIRYLCDRTAVLYLGRIAEIGPTEEIITKPRHPYTELLLAAVPRPDPDGEREHVDARGEIPDAIDLPNGCRFHARCPYALAHCGWEGRDLQRLLESRLRLVETPTGHDETAPGEDERRVLRSIESMTVVETDLVIAVTGTATADDVAGYVRNLMAAAGSTIGEAASAVEVTADRVTVRFPRFEEPPYYDIGDGHRVACHLYETGVTASLAEQKANVHRDKKAGA